ncbi:MAG: DbpA RNA binding domain-containing protein, partial [Anaerolineae bacterium]|nr:DbpA RNA binding domain-containing protein [Anaerolineae bacterium]
GYNVFEVAAAIMRMARADEAKRPIEEVREVRESVKERSQVREKRGKFRKQEAGMTKLKMNIGHVHGVRPGDIVGAIAGEAGIPGSAIGAISIEKKQTFVDVESAHVPNVIKKMRKSKLRGQPIQLVTA